MSILTRIGFFLGKFGRSFYFGMVIWFGVFLEFKGFKMRSFYMGHFLFFKILFFFYFLDFDLYVGENTTPYYHPPYLNKKGDIPHIVNNKNQITMVNLESFVLPAQEQATLETVGTLNDIIESFKAASIVKTKFGMMLRNKEGKSLYVGISKALGEKLSAGEIKPAQLGTLDVIKGENANGETRLYVVQQGGATIAADEFVAASKKAGQYNPNNDWVVL